MKLSDLIEVLSKTFSVYGDMNVVIMTNGEAFYISFSDRGQKVTRSSDVDMARIYRFQEKNTAIEGEMEELICLAEILRDVEGTLGDLRYQIEYAFDIDGVRSQNVEDADRDDPCYTDRYLKPLFTYKPEKIMQ